MNSCSKFERKGYSIKENENIKNKMKNSVKKSKKFKLRTLLSFYFFSEF